MVESILTKEMIDIGKALIERLDKRNLSPDAAFWRYVPETQQRKLVIAKATIETIGPKEIYRRIQQILAEPKNKITGLSLDDVSLAKPDAPIIVLLRVAIRTGPGISGIRFKNNVVNGTLIEDAYIYRMN
jgi:hypothetical protein